MYIGRWKDREREKDTLITQKTFPSIDTCACKRPFIVNTGCCIHALLILTLLFVL